MTDNAPPLDETPSFLQEDDAQAYTLSAPPSRQPCEPADALQVLRDVFGYSAFRGGQAEIVEHVGAGGDALVLMPTGGGKSLCYQVPAIVR
ncbi:MAG: DEAD/DEAH box helicase, partial [Rubrivivax sp.]